MFVFSSPLHTVTPPYRYLDALFGKVIGSRRHFQKRRGRHGFGQRHLPERCVVQLARKHYALKIGKRFCRAHPSLVVVVSRERDDRSAPLGKRKYAAVKYALRLGRRNCSVKNVARYKNYVRFVTVANVRYLFYYRALLVKARRFA